MAGGTIGDVKLLAPLRERDFALLWTGMTVSLLGDGIFIVAEAWQVYDIHNDPVALSLVGLAWTAGMTAFLLTGGITRGCRPRCAAACTRWTGSCRSA
jgi:hypothetical protein